MQLKVVVEGFSAPERVMAAVHDALVRALVGVSAHVLREPGLLGTGVVEDLAALPETHHEVLLLERLEVFLLNVAHQLRHGAERGLRRAPRPSAHVLHGQSLAPLSPSSRRHQSINLIKPLSPAHKPRALFTYAYQSIASLMYLKVKNLNVCVSWLSSTSYSYTCHHMDLAQARHNWVQSQLRSFSVLLMESYHPKHVH